MSRRIIGVVLVLALVALLPACKKLPAMEANAPGAAQTEARPSPDQVPAAWGALVGVSSVSEYPDLVQLWFQDDQKNVRMVVYRLSTHQLVHAKLIRRG